MYTQDSYFGSYGVDLSRISFPTKTPEVFCLFSNTKIKLNPTLAYCILHIAKHGNACLLATFDVIIPHSSLVMRLSIIHMETGSDVIMYS